MLMKANLEMKIRTEVHLVIEKRGQIRSLTVSFSVFHLHNWCCFPSQTSCFCTISLSFLQHCFPFYSHIPSISPSLSLSQSVWTEIYSDSLMNPAFLNAQCVLVSGTLTPLNPAESLTRAYHASYATGLGSI